MIQAIHDNLSKPQTGNEDESIPLLPHPSQVRQASSSTEVHGYLWMAASCLGFSGMSFFVHVAEDRYNFPTSTSVFIRGFFQTVLSILFIFLYLPFRQTFTNVSQKQWKLLAFRGFAGSLGIVVFFIALQRLPIGEAVTLFFCGPVMTMALSSIVLGEPITMVDGIAAVISFIGIILIARPDVAVETTVTVHDRIIGCLCGLAGASLSAVAYVTIRSMGTSIHFLLSVLALGVTSLCTSALLGGVMRPEGLWKMKEGTLLTSLAAIFAFAGQCCITKGLQLCRAGPGVLIRNLDVPIAYVLGISFLQETPTLLRLFGSTLVLFSAFMIGMRQMVQS